MTLDVDAKKKVPSHFQDTKEFKEAQQLFRKYPTKAALQMFLDTEIARSKAWLSAYTPSPSGNRHRRESVRKLELYMAIRKLLVYL
jgi:hypothetical protein